MNTKILRGLGVLIVIGIIVYFFALHESAKPTTSAPDSNATTQQIFSSDKLGISFKYLPDQDGDGKADTTVKESGDKVYVYYSSSSPEDGQWLQKFTKDPSDTLEQAISKQFLANYSAKDCYPMNLTDLFKSYNSDPPKVPANFDEAVITYPKSTDPNASFFLNADKCPETYTFTNGLSYFLMDKSHTDRYYFVSIGQYGILGDTSGTAWQDTISVK